jgi:mono/diheme cytochrome c family protein
VRAATLTAAGLACAGSAMCVAAFAAGGEAPRARAARSGVDVWLEQGCGSCHTYAPAGSTGPIGPDLGVSLRGKPRDYVLQSIVLPYAAFADGYSGSAMPGDYAQRIAPRDLAPLVDFLMRGAAG